MAGAIHHIEIYVSSLQNTIVFWSWLLTEKFNYSIYQEWEKGISFKYKDMYIVFVQTEDSFISASYHRKNTGLNHLAFSCDTQHFVDQLTRELKEKKITILYEDLHPYAGGKDYYAVFFEDPDRIKVEVVVTA